MGIGTFSSSRWTWKRYLASDQLDMTFTWPRNPVSWSHWRPYAIQGVGHQRWPHSRVCFCSCHQVRNSRGSSSYLTSVCFCALPLSSLFYEASLVRCRRGQHGHVQLAEVGSELVMPWSQDIRWKIKPTEGLRSVAGGKYSMILVSTNIYFHMHHVYLSYNVTTKSLFLLLVCLHGEGKRKGFRCPRGDSQDVGVIRRPRTWAYVVL